MRFSTFFSKQAQKPYGWFGRLVMSRIFDIGNARLNRLVYQILMPQPGDHILDLGCGTGKLVHEIACRMEQRSIDPDVFRIFEAAEVETILMNTGYVRDVATRSIEKGSSVFHCAVATRHEGPI